MILLNNVYLVDLERVPEHVLPDGLRLDLPQLRRHPLQVLLIVAHLSDRHRVDAVLVYQARVSERGLQEVRTHADHLGMYK